MRAHLITLQQTCSVNVNMSWLLETNESGKTILGIKRIYKELESVQYWEVPKGVRSFMLKAAGNYSHHR